MPVGLTVIFWINQSANPSDVIGLYSFVLTELPLRGLGYQMTVPRENDDRTRRFAHYSSIES